MGLTYLSTQTASSDSQLEFTSGIDSTYDAYEFHIVNIHAATSGAEFEFRVSDNAAAGYGETKTSTFFNAYQNTTGGTTSLTYEASFDLAESTSAQTLAKNVNTNNADNVNGVLTIYKPSSETYVKHFMARMIHNEVGNFATDSYVAGYINNTNDIYQVLFKFSSGNIDAGKIHMYGVS